MQGWEGVSRLTHIELALLGTVIGLVGVSGGKVWATKRIDGLQNRLEVVREEFRKIHLQCHDQCKATRIEREFLIEGTVKSIQTEVGQRLKVIEERQLEVFAILKDQKEQLSNQLNQLTRLIAWLEKNGGARPNKEKDG